MNEYPSTDNILTNQLKREELQIEEGNVTQEKQRWDRHTLIPLVFKVAILTLIYAHFIWATVYFINVSNYTLDETTCTGYGFWMIVIIFISFGMTYKIILKPHVIPLISKFLWKPVAQQLKRIKYGAIMFYVLVLIAVIVYLIVDTDGDRRRLMPLSGLVIYLIIGFLISSDKRKIPWHTVIWGLILQFVMGLLMIRWETGRNIFDCLGNKVTIFLGYAVEGSAFVYGDLLVMDQKVFAFNALATIYFLAFIINILYYYEIMQDVVASLGKALQWVMGTSICESVNSAANIFLGMSEAPLLLKPYLSQLTDSEIHSVMTSGFATVSGTVLAAYISFGASAAHLITASVMSAPAALCISKLIYPETEEVVATKENIKKIKVEYESVLDAASRGASDATQIVLGIIANVLAFVAFISFVNGVLSWLGILVGFTNEWEIWTVDLILGKIFIPITYTMGVEWEECEKVGQLIGIKTMVNVFVAFQRMGNMTLTPKSKVIATYSICGFANPGSIGIMLSALGTLVPNKKEVLTRLVFRAFVGGCITCFMTACIAGLLIPDGSII